MIKVIVGPPCSGKSTYVNEHKSPGDVVIDFDIMAQSFGSDVSHGHSEQYVKITVAAWLQAIIEASHNPGISTWVIDTKPTIYRKQIYANANAQILVLRVDKAELHKRANDANRPALWHERIDRY